MIAFAAALAEVPVDPDAPEARRWLIEELAKPEYQAARPSWFDQAAKAVWDWLTSLTVPGGSGWDGLLAVALAVLAAGVLTVVFLVYGRPRLNRRVRASALLDAGEQRGSRELRRSAEAAASRGDWTSAIEERFRALAVALDERTLVSLGRGTTAQAFAAAAAAVFPERRPALRAAADAFDGVRYLRRQGTREQYEAMTALDVALGDARPALHDAAPVPS